MIAQVSSRGGRMRYVCGHAREPHRHDRPGRTVRAASAPDTDAAGPRLDCAASQCPPNPFQLSAKQQNEVLGAMAPEVVVGGLACLGPRPGGTMRLRGNTRSRLCQVSGLEPSWKARRGSRRFSGRPGWFRGWLSALPAARMRLFVPVGHRTPLWCLRACRSAWWRRAPTGTVECCLRARASDF